MGHWIVPPHQVDLADFEQTGRTPYLPRLQENLDPSGKRCSNWAVSQAG